MIREMPVIDRTTILFTSTLALDIELFDRVTAVFVSVPPIQATWDGMLPSSPVRNSACDRGKICAPGADVPREADGPSSRKDSPAGALDTGDTGAVDGLIVNATRSVNQMTSGRSSVKLMGLSR